MPYFAMRPLLGQIQKDGEKDGHPMEFFSGDPICSYLNGNPLCARIAAAIFRDLSIEVIVPNNLCCYLHMC